MVKQQGENKGDKIIGKLSYKRHDMTDEKWDATNGHLPGQEEEPGRTPKDKR